MKIGLVSVFVPDPIRAFKFYTEVLGFVEKMYMPEHQIAIIVSSEQPDGAAVLLEPNQNLGAAEFQKAIYGAGLPCIIFNADDVQKDYDRLTSRGVKFTQEPTKTEWGTQAIFDDTCGNLIQLHQA